MPIITVDLYAGQIQGFSDIPVDNLQHQYLKYMQEKLKVKIICVAPDVGGTERARALGKLVGLAIVDKRPKPGQSKVTNVTEIKISHVTDDIIDPGGTIVTPAKALKREVQKKFMFTLLMGF